jgi:diadenosine tetraphosphate (Ap4A) HIT family hydrolase
MLGVKTAGFELDRRLESDTRHVMWLGLCELRLMDDCRWPWLVLVPQRRGATEVHDMTPLDQALLTFETNMVAEALKDVTGCTKINTGALGNIVRQLHVHVVARFEGDANWPGPVWGHGEREPYRREDAHQFADRIASALSPQR